MSDVQGEPRAIVIDAMGGDHGPSEVIQAVALVLKEVPNIRNLILAGKPRLLQMMLNRVGLKGHPKLSIQAATEVIGMNEKPIAAIKSKKDSSMLQAIELVKEGQAGAIVSLGNTGALMAASTLRLRPIAGIERPALAAVVPSYNHHFLLIDSGANPDPSPLQMVHSGVLGRIYYKSILPNPNPRVGLLSIGTEEGKGTDRVNQAHEEFKKIGDKINYIGLIEGFDTFRNVADVVVTDGFTGNCILKCLESCFTTLSGYLKEELTATLFRQVGAALSKGAYTTMKEQLNPARYSGAPLLGINGLVLKTHGSSDRKFISSAIRIANEALNASLIEKIHSDIQQTNNLIEHPESEA